MDRTNHRRTPLHLAVVKRQLASLAALIELGADLNLRDAVGLTPLDQAALEVRRRRWRDCSSTPARQSRCPPLSPSSRADEVERLVRDDPEVLSTTNNRQWARLLVHASGRASGRIVETLLRTAMRHRAGLSIVNMEDDTETAVDGASGYTPLHAAAFHGNDEAVAVLLKHGANPRTRDGKYCGTPAGWAAYAGHQATAHRILDADIDIFDAISFDRADRVAEILDRDPGAIDRPFRAYASCGSRDDQWWPAPDCTPLEWATTQRKENAVRVLTEHGAGARTRVDTAARRAHRRRFCSRRAGTITCTARPSTACTTARRSACSRRIRRWPATASTPRSCAASGKRWHASWPRGRMRRATRGGARGWTPILYLAYTRLTHQPTIEHALAIARLLLDHGADPNDFYMAGDARYTVLTGVAGEGEQDAPRQPYAAALFELLLERGAEPFDMQVLYNTHFSGDMLWWLELVYKHTVDTPRGRAWRDPEWTMFDMGGYGSGARFVLETAIKKRNIQLAEWAAGARRKSERGARARQAISQAQPVRTGADGGLCRRSRISWRATAPRASPWCWTSTSDFSVRASGSIGTERGGCRARIPSTCSHRPRMFEAAKRDRPDVLALLLELGSPLEMQDKTGKRALHEAAANNALRAATFLVERGARRSIHASRCMTATPMGWAAHGDETGDGASFSAGTAATSGRFVSTVTSSACTRF